MELELEMVSRNSDRQATSGPIEFSLPVGVVIWRFRILKVSL